MRQQTSAAGAGATVSQYYERPRFVQQEATLRAMNAVDRLREYKTHRDNLQPGEKTSPAAPDAAAPKPSVMRVTQDDIGAAMRHANSNGSADMIRYLLTANARANVTHNTTHAPVSHDTAITGPITVNTQARDAPGIARDLRRALKASVTAGKANGGPA